MATGDMYKDDKNRLLNCAAGLGCRAVFSPLIFFLNVSADALTVLIKADESVLRAVYIEYATLLSISQLQRNTKPLQLIFCNLYL